MVDFLFVRFGFFFKHTEVSSRVNIMENIKPSAQAGTPVDSTKLTIAHMDYDARLNYTTIYSIS